MATIKEDYVSFETSKLLKEKGFNEPCICYSYGNGMNNYFSKPRIIDGANSDASYILLPTQQMAMRWLREVHNCPIEILWHWDANSQCSQWCFMHHMELKPLPQIQYYDTYEEACEAAIKYCLENLI